MSQGVRWVWSSTGARGVRAALAPAEWLYRAVMAARNAAYDAHIFATHVAPIPVVSIGNVCVGGSGKTPFAAFIVERLLAMGGQPGVALRGYAGGDEVLVHRVLNPSVAVAQGADRLAAVAQLAAGGVDIAVLDDAFQHRRIARTLDVVLVPAERLDGPVRLLPAGEWREPLGAIRRAHLTVVTRKVSSLDSARRVAEGLSARGARDVAVVAFPLDRVVDGTGTAEPLSVLRGRRVGILTAIADPDSLVSQVREAGASVQATHIFRDHHRFSDADVRKVAAASSACDMVLCTLKDMVKLQPMWPRDTVSMRYVSQRVVVDVGRDAIDAQLQRALSSRFPSHPTVRQTSDPHAD